MDYQDQRRSASNGINPANPLILKILILIIYESGCA